MNRHDQAWQRLAAAARRAPEDRDDTAPFGFATRVAAVAFTGRSLPTTGMLLEKFALRGLLAACACSVAAAAFGYSVLTADPDSQTEAGDLVSEVLAQS